jgi:hypothetical protein
LIAISSLTGPPLTAWSTYVHYTNSLWNTWQVKAFNYINHLWHFRLQEVSKLIPWDVLFPNDQLAISSSAVKESIVALLILSYLWFSAFWIWSRISTT